MTLQEKLDHISHLKGESHEGAGRITEILIAPHEKLAKYLETRHKKGQQFADLEFASYDKDVMVLLSHQQIHVSYRFNQFIERFGDYFQVENPDKD